MIFFSFSLEGMIDIAISFVIIVAVVSATSFTFQQPKMPCAYQLHFKAEQDGKEVYEETYVMNGPFAMMKQVYEGESYVSLARPDLSHRKNGKEVITLFKFSESECEVVQESLGRFLGELTQLEDHLFLGFQNRSWKNKETVRCFDKECDYYHDDDCEGIYVKDDYIVAMFTNEHGIINRFYYDYEWKAPMESFVLSKKDYPKCVEQENRVAEVPSGDFAFCAPN